MVQLDKASKKFEEMLDHFDSQELNAYEVGKTIGKGSYSVVKRIEEKSTGKVYALKIYDKIKNMDFTRKNNIEVL